MKTDFSGIRMFGKALNDLGASMKKSEWMELYRDYTKEELKELLPEAEEKERYEQCAAIRDLLNKKTQ